MEREIPGLGHGRENYVAVDDIYPLFKSLVLGACASPSQVGKPYGIWERGVGEGECGGLGHGTGDIGHGVMHYAVDSIYGIGMGGGHRGLEASTLVDGHIHQQRAGTHQPEHVAGYKMGRLGTRYKYRSYHKVGCG